MTMHSLTAPPASVRRPAGSPVPRSRLAGVLVLAALAAGCATTRAAAPAEHQALEVPPVPPRVVEAAPSPDDRLEPVGDLPPATVTPPVTKPRASSPREVLRENQKPEVKPEAPAPPDPALTPPPPQNTPPPQVLRTPATANAVAAERQIRDALTRARGGLNNVDYQRLSAERKKAYDEANDFISGAEAAIKASQLEFAKELADKAEKYAKELQGR